MASPAVRAQDIMTCVMDYIALQGVNGISVSTALDEVDRIGGDLHLRRYIWTRLQQVHHVLTFYYNRHDEEMDEIPLQTLSTPKDNTPSNKRKRALSQPKGNAASDATVEVVPKRIYVEHIDSIPFESLCVDPTSPSSILMVVASEELRFRALNIPRKAIVTELGDVHIRILEIIGQSRVMGTTVPDICDVITGRASTSSKAKVPTKEVKRIHSALDLLLSYDLVVKRMMVISAGAKLRRLNILHLPRFAAAFKPSMFDAFADFECDEGTKKILCLAAEQYLRKIPTRSAVLFDLACEIGLHRRLADVLKLHVIQEMKKDDKFHLELFQAVVKTKTGREHKLLNCIRLREPKQEAIEDVEYGITIEQGLLEQIYRVIEKNGENGTTVLDLREQLVLPGNKIPYKLLAMVASAYELKAETILLGKNKAFRLYPKTVGLTEGGNTRMRDEPEDSIVFDAMEPIETNDNEGEEEPAKRRRVMTRLMKQVDGIDVRRREYIMERVLEDKVISVNSLRASMIEMEKNIALQQDVENSTPTKGKGPHKIGSIDTRTVSRLSKQLQQDGQVHLVQLALPQHNVSSRLRYLLCIVLPGYEQDHELLDHYTQTYSKGERIRRMQRNADQQILLPKDDEDKGTKKKREQKVLSEETLRKRRKRDAPSMFVTKTRNGCALKETQPVTPSLVSEGPSSPPEPNSPPNVMTEPSKLDEQALLTYRVQSLTSQMKSRESMLQYRRLGLGYGVMYRCRLFHQYLWTFLHENQEFDIGDSIAKSEQHEVGTRVEKGALEERDIVFSREAVLHQMPVHLYICVFSGGDFLTPTEFTIVQQAIEKKLMLKDLPRVIREKIWSRESARSAKILGTLADLDILSPYKLGMQNVVIILRSESPNHQDELLSQALRDNAVGGLFRMRSTVRIKLSDTLNDRSSIRLVGSTEKQYSFGNDLPLEFKFTSVQHVDRYWEALECLCLEKGMMEVPNANPSEPSVCEVPKPVLTRAIRMYRPHEWILKADKKKSKSEQKAIANQFGTVGIVSPDPLVIPRMSKKVTKVQRKRVKKRPAHQDLERFEQWTEDDCHRLIELYIDDCKSRWRIKVPQGLQKGLESLVFRVPWLSRNGSNLISIGRKLGKRRIDIKKQLRDQLEIPTSKVMLEKSKEEMKRLYNPQGVFEEELMIMASPRLSALYRRAIMLIVSPQAEYQPLVAEQLISFWNADEIRLVWRYLWLKAWIVRTSERERLRGYSTSQHFHDFFKFNPLLYPLQLFLQAVEHETMITSSLEEMGGTSEQVDQVFEAEVPENATMGQLAIDLVAQVMGLCTLLPSFDQEVERERDAQKTLENVSANRKTKRVRKRPTVVAQRERDTIGFAAHLTHCLEIQNTTLLASSWQVEKRMTGVTLDDSALFSQFEAFSTADESTETASYNIDSEVLSERILQTVKDSGREGLALNEIAELLKERTATLLDTLDKLVEDSQLICVNGYHGQRYVVEEHGAFWLLRPYSVLNNTKNDPDNIVFNTHKVLSFPWLKMDGSINYPFLFSIQRKLLSALIMNPGMTEEGLYLHLERLLTIQDTRHALSLLVDDGILYVRAMLFPTSASNQIYKRRSLFEPVRKKHKGSTHVGMGTPCDVMVVNSTQDLLQLDPSLYTIFYFPQIECIQRFGNIIQEYQNTVSSDPTTREI